MVNSMACMISGSCTDKMKLLFMMYDFDKSGSLNRDEVAEMIRLVQIEYVVRALLPLAILLPNLPSVPTSLLLHITKPPLTYYFFTPPLYSLGHVMVHLYTDNRRFQRQHGLTHLYIKAT